MASRHAAVLSIPAARKLQRDHDRLRLQVDQLTRRLHVPVFDTPGPAGRLFYNASGETAPAHAVMAVTSGGGRSALEPLLRITKPSTTFARTYVVNGPNPVAGGGTGYCFEAGLVEVLYDAGTPALGQGWGPKPGQWSLTKFYPETATVHSLVDANLKILQATWKQITECWGEADGAIAKGATGTFKIFAGAQGAESDTGIELAGVLAPAHAFEDDQRGNIGWVNGQPEAYARECDS